MTFAFENLVGGTGRVIGLDAASELTEAKPLFGPALIIAGESASTDELLHAPSDAIVVRSVEDFNASQFVALQHTVVTADGFDLALELLESGSLNSASSIVWNLGLPLLDTLGRLSMIGLAKDITVSTICGDTEGAVVTTSRGSGAELEFESFVAGLQVDAALSGSQNRGEYSVALSGPDVELGMLRQKLLSVLEGLSPADAKKPATGLGTDRYRTETDRSAESLRLENDLILLKRRYDALERKYTALSNSRLGALTLRLWAWKNSHRNKKITVKDDEK